jgi:hypothetical protein
MNGACGIHVPTPVNAPLSDPKGKNERLPNAPQNKKRPGADPRPFGDTSTVMPDPALVPGPDEWFAKLYA